MRKVNSAPCQGLNPSGAGGTAERGVCIRAPTVAPTVPMSSTRLMALITLSSAAYRPTISTATQPVKVATATWGVALNPRRAEAPNRWSRKAAVTMPTPPMTNAQVSAVRMR